MPLPKRRGLMVTPSVYSYGGLLIAGIMESVGCNVKVTKKITDIAGLSINKGVVCLSLQSTTDLFRIKNYLRRLKKLQNKLIVAGGPAVQDPFFASKILSFVNCFVLGEGDETIVDILHVRKQNELENIKGLAIPQEHDVIITPKREVPELAGRPFPKIPADLKSQFIRGVNVYIETHRGCIGRCTFCQYCSMFGNRIRNRPINDIINETKYLHAHGIERIAFSGGDASLYGSGVKGMEDDFITLLRRASKIIGNINLGGPDIRPDSVSLKVLEGVKRFTEGWIFLGIESGSEKILRYIKKNVSLKDIRSAVELAKECEVSVLGSLMVGFIGESSADFLETKQLMEELRLSRYSINIVEPLPTTPYWATVKQTSIEENPLFMPSEQSPFRVKGLTIAEERSMILHDVAHKIRYGRKMSSQEFKRRLSIVRKEANRIRKLTLEIKKLG